MIDEALPIACALARRFEGFRARPYMCPAGIPTIGYGATYYLDGRQVKLTDPPVSREAAERMLLVMMSRNYLAPTLRMAPNVDTPGRLAALADFAFNLGLARLKGSTLRRRALAGDWRGVRVELAKWTRGGGRVLPGLVTRRAAEAALV